MHAKVATMLTWAISVTCMLGAGTCMLASGNMHVETQHLFLMHTRAVREALLADLVGAAGVEPAEGVRTLTDRVCTPCLHAASHLDHPRLHTVLARVFTP